jgi:hypothetical protein
MTATVSKPQPKSRVRSKAEFVRLLWSSPQADFVATLPKVPSFIVIERDKNNLMLVPWTDALTSSSIPAWIWWPCYFSDRDSVQQIRSMSYPTIEPNFQVIDLDDLKEIRDRYLEDLRTTQHTRPFT